MFSGKEWPRPALIVPLVAALASTASAQSPTAGWNEYTDEFLVQNRTSAPIEQRYTFVDGIHSCQLYKGEERVEMRWKTWPDQDIEHMFEADMMYEPGTSNTCVMQVKSNESGESVYMQVFNGNLHWGAVGTTPILLDQGGKWFNLKAAWSVKTGVGRVWIDNELKATRNHDKGVNWYFKNGTYGTNNHSKSNYKNIRFWRNGGSSGLIRPPALPIALDPECLLRYDARGARVTGFRSGSPAIAKGPFFLRIVPLR